MFYTNNDKNLTVVLSETLLSELQKYCSRFNNLETGGILIGRYELEERCANITKVLGPPKDSKHGKTTFVRGIKGVKKILDDYWNEGFYYLGEWHYHPNALPIPSSQDINQMKKISKDKKYNCPEPLLIIIGKDDEVFIESVFVSIRGNNLIEFIKK